MGRRSTRYSTAATRSVQNREGTFDLRSIFKARERLSVSGACFLSIAWSCWLNLWSERSGDGRPLLEEEEDPAGLLDSAGRGQGSMELPTWTGTWPASERLH